MRGWAAAASASTLCACAAPEHAPAPLAADASSDARPTYVDGGAATLDDGGPSDSGSPEGTTPVRADAPAVTCTDTLDLVYLTPLDLPPMTMAARGAIVRCAKDAVFSAADVASKLAAKGVSGVTPTTGTAYYRVAYRTYRDDGVPGIATARVYLPSTPRTLPLPIVAVAHPTEGLAPSCAPSRTPTALDDLALPWAAHGFAVIATDYAGLGNEGVQGYVDNHDEAHSLLDSARALRALLDPRALDDRVLLVGYSQGGGAVLAAQGLVGQYGAGGDVLAGVVFSAEYFQRLDSFGYVTMLGEPTALTISTGISAPVVVATRDYAYGYNVVGPPMAAATFPAGLQTGIQAQIEALCEVPFGGYLQAVAPHVGDLWDDAFRTGLLACIDGDAGCSGAPARFYQWLRADLVPPDPQAFPLLYVVALSDIIMPPAQEAACNIASLQAAGVGVQVCTDGPAQHTDVVPRNVAFALSWSEASLSGAPPPGCPSAGLPACQP